MKVRARLVGASLALAGAAAVAGCMPQPGPGDPTPTTTTSTTSTTTTTIPNPPGGCIDNTTDPFGMPGADHFYTGIPNTVGNMQNHASTDGTCSGARQPQFDYTAVLAANIPAADRICIELGGTGTSNTWKSQGWVAMGDHAYVCNAQP